MLIMNKVAFGRLLSTEAKLMLREPALVFWGVAFPVVLTVVFGLAGDKHDKSLGGLSLVDVYVPVMMVFSIGILALSAIPVTLATYREKGVLRRLSTTPMHPQALLGADFTVAAGVIAVAMALIVIVAKAAFAVRLPNEVLGWVVTLILSGAALLAIGALIASVATNARLATALGTILFFPMMFFAGLWVPLQQMGSTLRAISGYTPLGAAVPAIEQTMRGSWPSASHLIVLAVYALTCSLLAIRLFRWE
jgi:ABC-2 type transport system permease protein